jgi:hypothetical protein
MNPSTLPRTARELLELVRHYGPAVEDGDLVFETEPPPELDAALRVMHTGVRALLTRRRWWGSTSEKPRVIELNPAEPIPAGITLLAVEGDTRWDRIPPDARIDFPNLFAPAPSKR